MIYWDINLAHYCLFKWTQKTGSPFLPLKCDELLMSYNEDREKQAYCVKLFQWFHIFGAFDIFGTLNNCEMVCCPMENRFLGENCILILLLKRPYNEDTFKSLIHKWKSRAFCCIQRRTKRVFPGGQRDGRSVIKFSWTQTNLPL